MLDYQSSERPQGSSILGVAAFVLAILTQLAGLVFGIVYQTLPTGASESLLGFGAAQVLVTGALFLASMICSIECLSQRGSRGRILAAVALGATAGAVVSLVLSWLPVWLIV
jgi:hypothetical protein